VVSGPRVIAQSLKLRNVIRWIDLLQSAKEDCLTRFVWADQNGLGALYIKGTRVNNAAIVFYLRLYQLHAATHSHPGRYVTQIGRGRGTLQIVVLESPAAHLAGLFSFFMRLRCQKSRQLGDVAGDTPRFVLC